MLQMRRLRLEEQRKAEAPDLAPGGEAALGRHPVLFWPSAFSVELVVLTILWLVNVL